MAFAGIAGRSGLVSSLRAWIRCWFAVAGLLSVYLLLAFSTPFWGRSLGALLPFYSLLLFLYSTVFSSQLFGAFPSERSL